MKSSFKPVVLLVACALIGPGARIAHADEGVVCTLRKPMKVKMSSGFQSVDAGTAITVKVRRADWSTVVVNGADVVASTKVLEGTCAPLPPRPPEPAAPAEVVRPKKAPAKKPAVAVAVAVPEPPPPEVTPPPAPTAPVVTAAPEVSPVPPAPTPPAPTAPTTTTTTTVTADPPRRVVRVAVRGLLASSEDERLASVTTDAIVAELRKLTRLSVIGMDEVRALLDLEAEKQLVGCSDESCMAEIVEALGADVLIVGQVQKIGDGRVFGLKRLDARHPEAATQVNQQLDAEDAAVLAMVGPAIEQLFPEHPVKVGETRGVAPTLHLRLSPPPVPVWATVSVAAGGLVALAASGGAVAVNQVLRADAVALAKSSTLEDPVSGRDLVEREGAVGAAFVTAVAAGVSGAVVVAVAGVMALFTDWDGYADLDDDTKLGRAVPPPG
jgi:hypothetical protein